MNQYHFLHHCCSLERLGVVAQLALERLQDSLRAVAQLVGRLVGGLQSGQQGLQLLEFRRFIWAFDTLL